MDRKVVSKAILDLNPELAMRLRQTARLSVVELNVCILIRLSLNAKQIASLLGTQVKGVFNRQFGICRKLGLGPRESLREYLMRLDSEMRSGVADTADECAD